MSAYHAMASHPVLSKEENAHLSAVASAKAERPTPNAQ